MIQFVFHQLTKEVFLLPWLQQKMYYTSQKKKKKELQVESCRLLSSFKIM